MRAKIVAQREFDWNPPSLKITREFFAKCDQIAHLLDENPGILNLVHGGLESLAEMMEGRRWTIRPSTHLRNAIAPATWQKIDQALVTHAVAQKAITPQARQGERADRVRSILTDPCSV